MLRLPALQLALSGLIGLRPHYNPDLNQWAPDLLESRSGIYLNDVHPLISPENLVAALPKISVNQYPVIDETKQYRRGELFRIGATLYIATKSFSVATMEEDSYEPTDYISGRLRQLIDGATNQVFSALIQKKRIEGAPLIVEETNLYHGAGSIQNRIIKEGRFCGVEIIVKPGRDIVIRLGRFGIQADEPNPELNLYLYHSSQLAPIKIIAPKFQGSGTFAWGTAPDVFLTLSEAAYGPGGAFYLGYYENDVAGQIIDRQKDWTNAAVVDCGTCNPDDTAAFQVWSERLEFHPFSVKSTLINEERTLWDVERNTYNYGTNNGLNLTISIECDLTQHLARNEGMLADVISKQAAVNVLQIFANTTENNGIAQQCRQAALYQLDNRENYTPGLVKELEKALSALSFAVVDTDSPCLPKAPPKHRIRTAYL